mmetsp:Transcript_108718/g.171494  ORF Transcript_108718/g.171494 Transcript_108718/m.171494 type:complete len:95 (-) Transcript_108718:171-455(-)
MPEEGEGGGDAEGGGEKEEEDGGCKKCCLACLDCTATIFRTLVRCFQIIGDAIRRCCYPIKQSMLLSWDMTCEYYQPYNKGTKVPYTHVPEFKF